MACDRTAKERAHSGDGGRSTIATFRATFTNHDGTRLKEDHRRRRRARISGWQLDLYHMQVTEGDLQKRTEKLLSRSPRMCRSRAIPTANRNPTSARPIIFTCSMLLDRLGLPGLRPASSTNPKTTTGAGLGWAAK